ncbi:MAG TPA: oxygenase MpaB family protein [Dehalococcoidia bacterium]|nr:oxygenase MpaB family protein [Dehalococcoidia bacterium]
MFDDRSAIRNVSSEGVLVLGGGRALLMQVAHPSIAAGVADHSNFRGDRIGRLLRTLEATYALVFGTPEQAEAAARRVNAMHERVVGPGYRALDPDLLLWVHSTLIDTSLLMYSLFVRRLSDREREAYYRDARRMGHAYGLDDDALPRTYRDLDAYVREMVATLVVNDTARRIAAAIFAPEPPIVAPAMILARELTAELLPPSLRAQYGLHTQPMRTFALQSAAALSRELLPYVPRPLRAPPPFVMPKGGWSRAAFRRPIAVEASVP